MEKSKPFENLLCINRNQNGDYYFLYLVPKVKRGMHGKTKGHVDEVLIVGIPQSQLINYLRGELTEKTCYCYVEGTEEELKEELKI